MRLFFLSALTFMAATNSLPLTLHRSAINRATNVNALRETIPPIFKDLSFLAIQVAAHSQDSTLPLYINGNELSIDVADHVRNAGLALTLRQLAPFCSNEEASRSIQGAARTAARKIIDTWPHDIQAGSFAARTLDPSSEADIQRMKGFSERAAHRASHGLLEPRFERGEVLIALCELHKARVYLEIAEDINRAIVSGLDLLTWGPFSGRDVNEVFELNWYSQFLRAARDHGYDFHPKAAQNAALQLVGYASVAAQSEANFRVVTLEGLSALLPLLNSENEDVKKLVFEAIKSLMSSCLAPEVHADGCCQAISFIRHGTARIDITGHFVSALHLLLKD
jgi:hypothetical protein